eukprot:scaffold201381_cov47-Attheya_sp.AAC.2
MSDSAGYPIDLWRHVFRTKQHFQRRGSRRWRHHGQLVLNVFAAHGQGDDRLAYCYILILFPPEVMKSASLIYIGLVRFLPLDSLIPGSCSIRVG